MFIKNSNFLHDKNQYRIVKISPRHIVYEKNLYSNIFNLFSICLTHSLFKKSTIILPFKPTSAMDAVDKI